MVRLPAFTPSSPSSPFGIQYPAHSLQIMQQGGLSASWRSLVPIES